MNRRYVLKSAGKLAYAAPLVVASAKVTERQTFAACSPVRQCGPCETCDDVGGCIPIPGCIP